MSPKRMREIAQAVCDYADEHGYARDKDVDEIVEDLEFVEEFKCPDEIKYLYEFIDYDRGAVMDMVDSIFEKRPHVGTKHIKPTTESRSI